MRLAHRLVLASSAVVALVMTAYGVASVRRREQIIGDALIRETETLAHAMQIVANSGIRNGQLGPLDRVLDRILHDPETAIGAVLDSTGAVIAGGPAERLACLDPAVRRPGPIPELHQWSTCGGRVRLVVLPLRRPAEVLVLARRTTFMDREIAASRRSILLTSIALATLGSLAILTIVRLWLTRPLNGILDSLRGFGEPALPKAMLVPNAARELRDLARSFNQMVGRLEEKQRVLARETEERIALERRLRDAEVFAAVGRLTGGVAHELGSPLGVIGVRAEAIQALPGADPAAVRHAGAIGREVERISELVRDLVHVARRHGAGRERVDLRRVMAETVRLLGPDAEDAGILLQSDAPAGPVAVTGDPRLLRQALYCVGLNAVQALRTQSGPRVLRLELRDEGANAVVTVDDSGPGIAPEDRARVFEPFFTTKDVGEGSGLGLAISAGIADEHGGELSIGSSALGGVRAEFRFPVVPPARNHGAE